MAGKAFRQNVIGENENSLDFMKTRTFLSIACSFVMLTGCVQSHRTHPVVYSTTPAIITEPVVPTPNTTIVTPAPTVLSPTSDRPVVRVYPEAPAVVDTSAATSAISSQDLATADTIRKLLIADPTLASAARNVRISVLNGQITMTGTVLTQHDREMLRSAIARIPGAFQVDDRVQVELNH